MSRHFPKSSGDAAIALCRIWTASQALAHAQWRSDWGRQVPVRAAQQVRLAQYLLQWQRQQFKLGVLLVEREEVLRAE